MKIQSPLQLNHPLIQKLYKWHQGTHALAGQWGQARFGEWLYSVVDEGWSWGVFEGEELVGIGLVEPISLPGSDVVRDGFISIALARKAWGKGIWEQVGWEMMHQIFEENPNLQRLSAWTLETNAPARSVAEGLGFTQEGLMRDAACWQGKTQNLVLYGLTRRDFYGRRT